MATRTDPPAVPARAFNSTLWGCIFAATAVALWGGNVVVGRAAPDAGVPPIGLNVWRWIMALAILLPFAGPRAWAQRDLLLRHWKFCVGFGIATVGLFNPTLYIGLQYTTAVQGTLITGILPALVLIAVWLLYRTPISRRQAAGVAICFAGLTVIVSRGDRTFLDHLDFNVGDLWVLGATVLWTVQTIMIRKLPKGIDLLGFQVVVFAVGIVFDLPFYLWETWTVRPMPVTWTAFYCVAYVAIAASVIGYTFWNMGAIRAGPANAGYIANLFPVFSAIAATLFLGERLEWFHWAGGAIIAAGIWLATVVGAPTNDGAGRRPAP